MATMRPLVRVFGTDNGKPESTVIMPSVFCAPLRPDLVRTVHTNMAKNHRQTYGVSSLAGHQTSAHSWGTGRAVSRTPRVSGAGTHRSGEAAIGNMCRGGHMFNPNRTWRKIHRKINRTEKRHALASAIAATAVPGLVLARGHNIEAVPELPLIVTDNVQSLKKTKDAISFFKRLGCKDDLEKVASSKKIHSGRGKLRNRRYTMRRGPLLVYKDDEGIVKAMRNIPGVDFCHVSRLNLLKLAPGGTIGRFCIYTKSAIAELPHLYGKIVVGSGKAASESILKKGYRLQHAVMANGDLTRIINSNQIQSVLKPMKKGMAKKTVAKNLITNRAARCRVNPIAKRMHLRARMSQVPGSLEHTALQKRKALRLANAKKHAPACRKQYREIMDALSEKKRSEEEKTRLEREAYLIATQGTG